jgi:hypothetical protein
MEDPQAAADALYEFAVKNQLDLDYVPKEELALSRATSGTERYRFHLPSGDFTPSVTDDSFSKEIDLLVSEKRHDMMIVCLIQTESRLSLNQAIQLLRRNVRFYLTPSRNTYLVRMSVATAHDIKDEPYIRWMGEYKSEYKYGQPPKANTGPGALITSFEGDKQRYRDDLEAMGIDVIQYDKYTKSFFVYADYTRFKEISELRWVRRVCKELEYSIQSQWVTDAESRTAATEEQLHFKPDDSRHLVNARDCFATGEWVNVGVHDSGFKKDASYYAFDPNSISSQECFHGTHVSSIILGTMDQIDVDGTPIGGVAPDAKLLFLEKTDNLTPTIALSTFNDNEVLTTNHSYGSDDYNYDNLPEAFDIHGENMVIVVACGNTPTAQHIANPALAKNVLAVGAVNYVSNATETIGAPSSYSVAGPTNGDNRLKPELVAPGGSGNFEYGVVAHGGSIECEGENGLSAHPWPASYEYFRMSGTSQAAPHVAGAAAQAYEYFSTSIPSIASDQVKAVLVNSAIPLKASSDYPLRGYWSNTVGYGLVNPYLSTTHESGTSCDDTYERLLLVKETVQEGFRHEIPFQVSAPATKLIATLVYNDWPGQYQSDNVMWNDLDLELKHYADTQYTEMALPSGSKESPIEKIIIENPLTGQWYLNVHFENSNLGTPGQEQAFAVVVDVIYEDPELEIVDTIDNDEIIVDNPGDSFAVPITVSNAGGAVAAGVTVHLTDPGSILGDQLVEYPIFVGSLIGKSDAVYTYALTAPIEKCSFDLELAVDGINREFNSSSYPKTKTIKVTVGGRKVYGHIKTPMDGYVEGIPIDFVGTETITTATQSNGYYETFVDDGWEGDVIPQCPAEFAGTGFDPPSIHLDSITSETPIDPIIFEIEAFEISGYVKDEFDEGLVGFVLTIEDDQGVTVKKDREFAVTDESGFYQLFAEHTWSGIVKPVPTAYYNKFTPYNQRGYGSLDQNWYSQDFFASNDPNIPVWAGNGIPVVTEPGDQDLKCQIHDGYGGSIMVWKDISNGGIYAQRVSAQGQLWPNKVEISAAGSKPSMTTDGAGGAIISWFFKDTEDTPGIAAQRIAPNGNALWGPDGVNVTLGSHVTSIHGIVTDQAGGAIVVWYREDNDHFYGRRIDDQGDPLWNPSTTSICPSGQENLSFHTWAHLKIIPDCMNGAIIAWNRLDYIHVQQISAEGDNPPWEDGRASSESPWPRNWDVISDSHGGVYVARITQNDEIRVSRIKSNGESEFGAKQIFHHNDKLGFEPVLTPDNTFGAIVTWRVSDGTLRTQRVSADGEEQWKPNGVVIRDGSWSDIKCDYSAERHHQVVSDGMGGAIIHFEMADGSYVQRTKGDGRRCWTTDGIAYCSGPSEKCYFSVVSDGERGAYVAWSDNRIEDHDIYANKIYAGPKLTSPDGGEIWITGQEEVITWEVADDVVGIQDFEIHYSHEEQDYLIVSDVGIMNTGEYTWTVEVDESLDLPISNFSLKVLARDGDGGEYSDFCDDLFTICEGIEVIAPDGGEMWSAGRSYTIEWTLGDLIDLGLVDYFEIELLDGTQHTPIGSCDGSQSEFEWTLPDLNSEDCSIEITAYDSEGQEIDKDSSDDLFTIYKVEEWAIDGIPACTASDIQKKPVVTGDGFGGTIVAWVDHRDSFGDHIYAERFDADGNALWTSGPDPLGIPIYTLIKDQFDVQIIGDGTGGAVFAWEHLSGYDVLEIRAQRVDGTGATQWPSAGVVVYSNESFFGSRPGAVSDGAGGAIFGWMVENAIYTQRVNENGELLWGEDGVCVSSSAVVSVVGEESEPVAMVANHAGGCYFVWSSDHDGSRNIYMQGVDSSGQLWALPEGSDDPGLVVCSAEGDQWFPQITFDPVFGGALVAWYDERESGFTAIYANRTGPAGTQLWLNGAEVVPSVALDGVFLGPQLVSDGAGGAVVTWEGEQDSDADILAQKLDEFGQTLWASDGIAICDSDGDQGFPRIVSDYSGGALIVWNDSRNADGDIFAQRIDAAGNIQLADNGAPICLAEGDQKYPMMVEGGVITWWDKRNDGGDIYVQKILGGSGLVLTENNVESITWEVIDAATGEPLEHTVVRGCPAGDFDALKVTIDFDESTIPAGSVVEAASITLDKPETMVSFWNEGPITAENPATGPNYKTTIIHPYIGGCSVCDTCETLNLPVRVNGVIVGEVNELRVKSPDANDDGSVSMGDMGVFGLTYNKCGTLPPAPEYNDCMDFTVPFDTCVYLSDLGVFGPHYNSCSYPTGSYPMLPRRDLVSNASVKFDVKSFSGGVSGDELHVSVYLVNADGVSDFAAGLDNQDGRFDFLAWEPNPGFKGQPAAAAISNRGRNILFISAFDIELSDPHLVELGTLRLGVANSRESIDEDDFELVFGDVINTEGEILKIKGVEFERAEPLVLLNYLGNCHPNPFNPTTAIDYAIKERGHVTLKVYNVAGQLVRTLVDENQAPSSMRQVMWHGRNDAGQPVSSGVYFYRLVTKGFVETRKMVLLK